MHSASVRYHKQLKAIEERNKMSIIENKFECSDHFVIDNEFCSVCFIETEIDLDEL